MRFAIELTLTGRSRMVPIDYQYYLSAWIYQVIGRADQAFAHYLHSQGMADGNKQFKFFCFSPLKLGKPTFWKEQALLEIHSNSVVLEVAFHIDDAAERFVRGLFQDQSFYLGNRFNGVEFGVTRVERLAEPQWAERMKYRAVSPVVISVNKEGNKHATYLSPEDEDYAHFLVNNLRQKALVMATEGGVVVEDRIEFECVSDSRAKLVTIKPGTPYQSKVRGFVYEFELIAPIDIHRMIYNSGIGEKNSMGFGWCEVVT